MYLLLMNCKFLIDGYTFAVDGSDFITTWTESELTLPQANYLMFSVYDSNSRYPECWWLIGEFTN